MLQQGGDAPSHTLHEHTLHEHEHVTPHHLWPANTKRCRPRSRRMPLKPWKEVKRAKSQHKDSVKLRCKVDLQKKCLGCILISGLE